MKVQGQLLLFIIIFLLSVFFNLSSDVSKWSVKHYWINAIGMEMELEMPNASLVTPYSVKVDPTPLNPTIQAFLISSRQSQFDLFLRRNRAILSNNFSVSWFPASNGRDQIVLDQFANVTGFPPINASLEYHRDSYSSPHHTGCFMSHWNVIRLARAGWETLHTKPSGLMIFEYDALCATSVIDTVISTLPSLPADWDMLFVGGKPFSYYNLDPSNQELRDRKNLDNFTDEEFERMVCQGGFGPTNTGPFAPDGGRNLSLDQPYWQTKYITNLQSYILNPDRIDRILHLLEHPQRDQVPIDIAFAEAATSNVLKILMTTMDYCVQENVENDIERDQPSIWEGYYNVHGLQNYRWNKMFFPECPSMP